MTKKQTLAIIAITILYLLFELSFNARLLDVVGGTASPKEVEDIEVYGRTLSGVAAALVVLQILLSRRVPLIAIAICVAGTIGLVYWAIGEFVDRMVENRSAEFRRIAGNTTLVQRGLVEGKLTLAGLETEPGAFASPEGKAFLALFPLMAVSVDRLDENTQDLKMDLVEEEISKQAGGKAGYFSSYKKAMDGVRKQWTSYSRIPVSSRDALEARKDKAWADYQKTLAKRGWTPESIPGMAQRSVIRSVQNKGVPVPNNWDPADEYTFRKSVERKYEASMGKAVKGIKVGRHTIAPGLGFEAFVAHQAIQEKLREGLKLPASVRVAGVYRSDVEFERGLFKPFLKANTDRELKKYEAPVEDYEPGGKYEKEGLEASRVVIVPAAALAFSLMGAIGHLGKFFFLVITALGMRTTSTGETKVAGATKWLAGGVLATVIFGTLLYLNGLDNKITVSPLYGKLLEMTTRVDPDDTQSDKLLKWVLGKGIHIVSIGQGYGYPTNEWIRTRILQNFTYGYVPASK